MSLSLYYLLTLTAPLGQHLEHQFSCSQVFQHSVWKVMVFLFLDPIPVWRKMLFNVLFCSKDYLPKLRDYKATSGNTIKIWYVMNDAESLSVLILIF